MKRTFSEKVLVIWSQIEGKRGRGLAPGHKAMLIHILERDLGLSPIMVRFGDELRIHDREDVLPAKLMSLPDGHVTAFYLPVDCETATGSRAHNWTQWAGQLLGYGRKSHPWAPRQRPPKDVLDEMEGRGLTEGRKRLDFRFLSLELVIFYLAAQTRTWDEHRHNRILTMKDNIEKHGVETLGFVATQEEVDVGGMFPDEGADSTASKRPAGIPKAGQALVNYNPTGVPSSTRSGTDPVEDLVDSLVGSSVEATGEGDLLVKKDAPKDEDSLDDEIEAARRRLADLVYRKRTRELRRQAEKGRITDGETWPDKGRWATVKIGYEDGSVRTYIDAEIVSAGLGTGIGADELVREALGAAEDKMKHSRLAVAP
jgi:hypothetical protein